MEFMRKTVSARLYRWLFEVAEQMGYNTRPSEKVCGIEKRVIDAPDGRVGGDQLVRFLKLTANWPLDAAAIRPDVEKQLGPFPELAGVVCNSGTLREALRHFVKYRDLVSNVDWVLTQETSDRMAFDYVLEGEGRATTHALGNFAHLTGVARFYDPSTRISEVQSSGAPLDGYAIWNEGLNTRVSYYQSHNRLVLFSNMLDTPFERFNKTLSGIQLRAASQMREQIRGSGSFTNAVARQLRDWLHDGSESTSMASLQRRLCDELGISRWTLLRRLQSEDAQFQDLLLQARVGEAQALLLQTRLSIGEIADRMQFGSISAFSRFFTRTSGIAPSRFRAERQYGLSNNEPE